MQCVFTLTWPSQQRSHKHRCLFLHGKSRNHGFKASFKLAPIRSLVRTLLENILGFDGLEKDSGLTHFGTGYSCLQVHGERLTSKVVLLDTWPWSCGWSWLRSWRPFSYWNDWIHKDRVFLRYEGTERDAHHQARKSWISEIKMSGFLTLNL